MLRKFLLILALLACLQRAAAGGGVPRPAALETGAESTASSTPLPRDSRVVPAPATGEGPDSPVVITSVELERKSGRTSKSLRHEVPPHGGGSFERQARRELPPATRSRTKSRQSDDKREKTHNLQEEPDRGNKSIKKSPVTLTSSTEDRNASLAPEHNFLDDPKSKKTNLRTKLSRNALKDSRRFRRRRITKEQREFWDRLDQRNSAQSMAGVGQNHTEGQRQASNTSISSRKNDTRIDKPTDKVESTLFPIFEEFPFLSENYDYNDFYYDDDSILALTNTSTFDLREANRTETSTASLLSQRETPESDDIRTSLNTTGEVKSSSDVPASTATSEKVSIVSESSIKVPDMNFTMLTGSSNASTISLSKLLSDNLISLPRLQGRIMPNLEADETKQVHLFSVAPSTAPMTAIDSFRNRRQQEGNRDQSAPRDILKEFPIFRQFVKNEQDERKHLSLHERLQSRRFSTIQPDLEASTQSSVTSTTLRIIAIVSQSQSPPLAPPSTTSSTTSSKPTTSTDEDRLPLKNPSTKNLTESRALQSPASVKTIQSLNPKVEARTVKSSSGKLPNAPLPFASDKTSSTESPHPESVRKNVTFSTSKTHTEAATSPLDVLGPVILESQLGIAPLGETPFGLRPFGEIPMGEKPFGLSPEGLSPLGNFTSMESLSTNETDPQDGLDGRYHVQVTAPDGSINGDYIVVDPVTGDVNGVRYEAAHDVDPLLVQRALLNFLSLDPRLRPAEEDIVPTTEVQPSKSENATQAPSKVEGATSVVVEISEPTEPPELLKIVA